MRLGQVVLLAAPALFAIATANAVGPLEWARVADVPAGVVALATTAASPTTVMAAGQTIYVSTDGGSNWAGLAGLSGPMLSVAISPTTAAIALAAGPQGVLRTADGGRSWRASGSGLPPDPVLSLSIDPNQGATAYAGTAHRGVWRSTDGGDSWARSGQSPDLAIHALLIDPAHPRVLAGTDGGVLISVDGGGSWTLESLAPAGTGPRVLSLAGEFVGGEIFAGTSAGIFRSPDAGQSWSPLGGPTAPAGSVSALAMHTVSGQELLAGANGSVVASADLGATWTPAPGWPSSAATALAYLPLQEPVALGTAAGGGMYRIGEILSRLQNPGIDPALLQPSIPPGGLHISHQSSTDDTGVLAVLLGGAAAVAALGAAAFWWRRRLAGY